MRPFLVIQKWRISTGSNLTKMMLIDLNNPYYRTPTRASNELGSEIFPGISYKYCAMLVSLCCLNLKISNIQFSVTSIIIQSTRTILNCHWKWIACDQFVSHERITEKFRLVDRDFELQKTPSFPHLIETVEKFFKSYKIYDILTRVHFKDDCYYTLRYSALNDFNWIQLQDKIQK